MCNWKDIGKKLLFPPKWVVMVLAVFSTVSLIMIFVKGWEMTVAAYVVYTLSFYTLSVVCALCIKVFPGYYRKLKNKLYQNKYADKYLTDVVFKTQVGLYCSLVVNFIYVAVNVISAFVFRTNWFGIFAIYYGIIAIMRFLLVRFVMKNPIGTNRLGELKRARLCACILLTVNIALSGAVLMMIFFNRGFQYQGFLIYVIATYTFYITTTAIIDMVKYRKYKSPVMSIIKVIKMASALFSMLFLETAMFAQFGADTPEETKQIMIMITGAGISITVIVMAVYMVVQTSRQIKQYLVSEE